MAGRSSQPSEFHLFQSHPPAPSARYALFFRSEQFMADQANRDTRPNRPRPPMHRHMRPSNGNGNGDVKIDRELLAELDREEPLSLAEELDKAAERVRRVGAAIAKDDAQDRNVHIAELQRMGMPELIQTAEAENDPEIA